MTPHMLDAPRRQAARIAGVAFLLALAIVIAANYGISFRLSVPGDTAGTARSILEHEKLFRLNIAGNLLYAATIVVLLAALDVTLRPVSRLLSLVAAIFRLLVVVAWALTALEMLGTLRLLGNDPSVQFLGGEQRAALAALRLGAGYDAYSVGLPFWGLASTVSSLLWLRSRLVPRTLAAVGLVSSAWCVLCSLTFLALPDFSLLVNAYWFDSPMVVFEVALGLWLVIRGLRPAAPAAAQAPVGTGCLL